jgi:uncharacterized cupredoxin-like copper-binding protein
MKLTKQRPAVAGVCALAALGALAAGYARSSEAASGTAATVKVTLDEMRVGAAPLKIAAGRITFVARNAGSVDHEMVVVRRPSAGTLPLAGYKADEHGLNMGEIEGIKPGKSGTLTLTLKRGRYLLICNVPGHYQLGMTTQITAT